MPCHISLLLVLRAARLSALTFHGRAPAGGAVPLLVRYHGVCCLPLPPPVPGIKLHGASAARDALS